MKAFTLGVEVGRRFKDNDEIFELIRKGLIEKDLAPAKKPAQKLDDLLPADEPFRVIARSVARGEVDAAVALVKSAVGDGWDGLIIATDGLLKGMDAVSIQYNLKQAYVPEILLAARALDAGLQECGDLRALESKGTVLIHTADGDLHDIGKNIVAAVLESHGWDVIDLGKNVDAEHIVAAAKEHSVRLIGLSALMTTTMIEMEKVIRERDAAGIPARIMIGGAPVTERFAKEIGADGYAKDAVDAAAVAKHLSS